MADAPLRVRHEQERAGAANTRDGEPAGALVLFTTRIARSARTSCSGELRANVLATSRCRWYGRTVATAPGFRTFTRDHHRSRGVPPTITYDPAAGSTSSFHQWFDGIRLHQRHAFGGSGNRPMPPRRRRLQFRSQPFELHRVRPAAFVLKVANAQFPRAGAHCQVGLEPVTARLTCSETRAPRTGVCLSSMSLATDPFAPSLAITDGNAQTGPPDTILPYRCGDLTPTPAIP